MHVVLPVKSFAAAKTRLSPVMEPRDRAALVRAMLLDVLAAITAARGVGRILIVSAEPEVAWIAEAAGVEWLDEAVPRGMSAAVAAAVAHLGGRDGAPLLVLPADIPTLQAAEVEALGAAVNRHPGSAVLVRSHDGGTGALGLPAGQLSAGGGFPFRFGPDSHARHCQAALAMGLVPRSLSLPGPAGDIDLPADLAALHGAAAGPAVRAFLRRTSLHAAGMP